MRPTIVINIVGLSDNLTPHLTSLRAISSNGSYRKIRPVLPALTCSTQSTYLTGLWPSEHGIVGNGWYFHDLSQIWLWRQSNRLVQGKKVWEIAKDRDKNFTSANLFWWYNMYSSVDSSVTPRPVYRADGLKLPDIYTKPQSLRQLLQTKLGPFPLYQFWGPSANIVATKWIAQASQMIYKQLRPTLLLIYLPHLDYCLQKEGPQGASLPNELKALDAVCADLLTFFDNNGADVLILSEYGISPVDAAIPINQILREEGWLKVTEECGEDHLDPGASVAFALADHQISHVYVNSPSMVLKVSDLIKSLDGVEKVLSRNDQEYAKINHPRAGEIVAVAQPNRWFSYHYWESPERAPDFARTVDIHRKPGYDPLELFIDPNLKFPKVKMMYQLARKKLGMRYLMNLIPLETSLIRGSHGSPYVHPEFWPVLMSTRPELISGEDSENSIAPTSIKNLILNHIFE